MSERNKYKGMDVHLEKINRKFISFSDDVIRRNNKILAQVLDPLIEKMRKSDKLFDQLYNRKFYGGSYYDGLKVGSPDEYDIDLLLKFPTSHGIEIRTGEVPGFVNMFLHNKTGFDKFCSKDDKGWESFLDTNKVLAWMESVVQKGLNYFKSDSDAWYTFGNYQSLYVKKFHKGGPAFTLIIRGYLDGDYVEMDVDLVPCFLFGGEMWPAGFKRYSDKYVGPLAEFFVVPKKPKGVPKDDTKYWRLSFQIQERDIIHDIGRLKPALRLLKKMRDKLQHKQVSSYFLKTVVLWEVQTLNDPSFWIHNSLSYIFMHILNKYQECLEEKKILYFWNENYNLLDTARGSIDNISNRLCSIIKDIDRNIPDKPDVVVKYILTPSELEEFYEEPEANIKQVAYFEPDDSDDYCEPDVGQNQNSENKWLPGLAVGAAVGIALVPLSIAAFREIKRRSNNQQSNESNREESRDCILQ